MIRTTITPNSQTIFFEVPADYVGKEIEVIAFEKDEATYQKSTTNKNAARFKGLLTIEEADKFNTYLNEARKEWDRDF